MGPDNITYQVYHRKVKYPRLEFKTGELVVILPFGNQPFKLLEKHGSWIDRKSRFIEECLKDAANKEVVKRTDREFRDLVYSYIREASQKFGVRVNQLFFRKMKTKWASCSPKRNLTVNALANFLPDSLIKYVVYHEMTHLIEKRHNDRFWKIMSAEFGICHNFERDLFAYWFRLCESI